MSNITNVLPRLKLEEGLLFKTFHSYWVSNIRVNVLPRHGSYPSVNLGSSTVTIINKQEEKNGNV